MGVVSSYEVSAAFPSTVGGTGTAIKYFFSNPPQSLWNVGQPGVNSPAQSSQLGQVPSSTSALGQLPFPMGLSSMVGAGKLVGTRLRMYMSGSASSATTPTIQPVIQLNSGTVSSPSYSSIALPAASAALTANKPVYFSISVDAAFDYNAGNFNGSFKAYYASAAAGTPLATYVSEATLSATVTGLALGQAAAPPAGVGVGGGFPGFGFVCGITFGTSDASNTASLYEFKLLQD